LETRRIRIYASISRRTGKEKSVSTVSLGPNEKGQVLFSHAFDAPGLHVVEGRRADVLKADNVLLASIPVRAKSRAAGQRDPGGVPLKAKRICRNRASHPQRREGRAGGTAAVLKRTNSMRKAREATVAIVANVGLNNVALSRNLSKMAEPPAFHGQPR
jgi:hypothetical protein